MPKDDEGQVFDVSKPHKTPPSPTSRPIIVGHEPMMSDPMVKSDDKPSAPPVPSRPSGPRAIQVTTPEDGPPAEEQDIKLASHGLDVKPSAGAEAAIAAAQPTQPAEPAPKPKPEENLAAPPAVTPEHPESVKVASTGDQAAQTATPPGDLHLTPVGDLIGHSHHHGQHHDTHQLEHMPVAGPQNKRKKNKTALWILLGLIILVVLGYLAIDSRLIKTSINLPFHIFKQPVSTASTTPPANNIAPVADISTVSGSQILATGKLPVGWKWYQSQSPALKFAYPSNWKLTSDTEAQVTTVRLAPNQTWPAFLNSNKNISPASLKYADDPEVDLAIYSGTDPEPATPSGGLDNTISGPNLKKVGQITVNGAPSALIESSFTTYDDSIQLSGCSNLVCSFPDNGKYIVVSIKTLGSHLALNGYNVNQSGSTYKGELEMLKTLSF